MCMGDLSQQEALGGERAVHLWVLVVWGQPYHTLQSFAGRLPESKDDGKREGAALPKKHTSTV